LRDLLKYFEAKEILEDKFDSKKVDDAISKLEEIKQQSKLVDILKKNLREYDDNNNKLKALINTINIENKNHEYEAIINSEHTLDRKRALNSPPIAIYFYENGTTLIDYPHLSRIFRDIVDKKLRKRPDDLNADISNFLDKL